MKRDIKFRAWHKEYKKMYEVHDIILNQYPKQTAPKVWANCWGKDLIEDEDKLIHVEDLEFMQYIGKRDKNGNEIYEGDIIDNCEMIYEGAPIYGEHAVMRCDDDLCREMRPIMGGEIRNGLVSQISDIKIEGNILKCEIIGNIFDNKIILNN